VPLAREIAKLRKPTVSASAVNRLVREHPAELDELLTLGQELRDAWQAQDADALAELTRRRGKVTGRLARLVRTDPGLSPAAAAEVDRTLEAAVVDAGAAEQVRRGRLAKPLDYSGFAPAPSAGVRPSTRRRKPGDDAAEAGKREEAQAEQAREARQARKAEERAAAESAHREWSEALEVATGEHEKRAARVADLEAKLRKARAKLADSEHRLEVAQREERHARHRLER
jgi:hypothetical protein